MKIKFVVKPQDGPDFHRMVLPFDFYKQFLKEGDELEMYFTDSIEDEEFFKDTDILVFNRDIDIDADDLEYFKLKYGFKIIVDMDDYWEMDSDHYLYEAWYGCTANIRFANNMRMADHVTCTNLQMYEKILPLNSNITIIPNCFPFGHENFVMKKQEAPQPKMRFMYAAGTTHLNDCKLLKGKFRRIGDDSSIRNNAEFILAGYNLARESLADPWYQMAEIFSKTHSYSLYPSLDFDTYITHYDHADVAIVPLVDNEFNSCKSVLKVLEASVKGLPCIVSAVNPYLELSDAPGILWVKEPNDWLKHIRYCINHPEWVKSAGAELNTYMRERYDLIAWNEKRMALYNEVFNKITLPA